MIQRHLAKRPGDPWLTLVLAGLDRSRSEALYRVAARSFAARKHAQGEVLARSNLQRIFFEQGRLEEAGEQVEVAERIALASRDPEVIAQAHILMARHLTGIDKDLERAYLLLRDAEHQVFSAGTDNTKRAWLRAMGNVSQELGRFQEAEDAFRRLAEHAASTNDKSAEGSARYGLAISFFDSVAELPSEKDRRNALELARQTLQPAREGEAFGALSKAYWMIALLAEGEEARRSVEGCLDAAPTLRDQSYCFNALARQLTARDPKAAREATDRALALAQQAEDPFSMAAALRERMRVSWEAVSVERAVADSWAALDSIEEVRDLQAGSASQAEMFSSWAEDYYWFCGRLLEAFAEGGGARELEGAFAVAERLRARSLIDALEAAKAAPAASPTAQVLRRQRSQVLEAISAVQRRLMDPALPAAERAAAAEQLEDLEMKEANLRNGIAHADPVYTALRRPEFATLEQVRQALAPDEALLSFQIAPWQDLRGDFAGGSWLLVSTRASTRAYRLPGRGDLRPAVRLFVGTFEQRDGSEVGPSVYLYNELVGKALAELPGGIRRLVLIPDDALHQLPFGALRASADAPPLAARYQMSVVPSATLWLGWRQRRPGAAPNPALALADPPPLSGEEAGEEAEAAPAAERSAVFASAMRLGSLPYARRESRAVVRAMGGGSVRRLGKDASETFFKRADLARFGLIHLATHAVVDEQNPERSGVLLAAAGGDDGLLQLREIVDLPLDGRIVVLASCRSASGTLLRGEGVMGMARAFFQAGSHAVVASLWPLRDDEAALLFDRVYHYLGRGDRLAAALQAAQRDLIADGVPAAAWAGLVVLGDGDLVPLPGGRKLPYLSPAEKALAAAVLLALLGAGALAWYRRRRTRRGDVHTVPSPSV
ncbi:MAG TPA: CHAT domain-containing protein [Thermoanaerobaculia bacterium]|nr:CHAT domain-containing protein [Thermoanaerobaculia bacterium]